MKAAICNLGCRVNEYEAEKMAALLKKEGFVIVPFKEKADVYIVNTCTVTNIADRKSRQMLSRARKMNPDAVVIACGCYVDVKDEAFFREHGVDLAFKNSEKENIAQLIREYLKEAGKKPLEMNYEDAVTANKANLPEMEMESENSGEMNPGGNRCSDDAENAAYTRDKISKSEDPGVPGIEKFRERAFIKIQDGCNNFCSYCIIPYARGRIRSKRPEDVLSEIREFADNDYKEVILSGIHIGSYGLDRGEDPAKALYSLLEKVNGIPEIRRIRMGSVEPGLMTERFIKFIASLEKVCPQFHLSLQSGSDSVLKRMNRKYTSAQYYESCDMLREYFEDPAITTDIIVGFPGETEQEFDETVEFVKRVSFMKTHVFKYSKREGTVAAGMPCQVSDAVKGERSRILIELSDINGRRFAERRIGKEVEVLFEEKKVISGNKCWTGHTREYIPFAYPCGGKQETGDGSAAIPENLRNVIRSIKASGYEEGYLW